MTKTVTLSSGRLWKHSRQYCEVMKITKNGNHERIKTPTTIANVLVALSCFMICSPDERRGFELVSGSLLRFPIVIPLLLDAGELVIPLVSSLASCSAKKFTAIASLSFCTCLAC